MSRGPASLVILGCLASPLTPAADSLECLLAKGGWSSQREAGDLKAAARSFTTLARKCETAMRGTIGVSTRDFVDQLRGPDLQASRGEVLEALFASGYPYENGDEPGMWWAELARRRMEKRDLDGAKAVLARIDAFEALIAMQVDRRFDDLRKAAPDRFDLGAAVRRDLSRLRARVDADPKSLQARCVLAWRLNEVGRHPDGLALMDSTLAAGEQLFDDWKDQYPWALATRGFALSAAGQYPDALSSLLQADALTRNGSEQTKFAANLALVQVRLGKADEALANLRRAAEPGSYGKLLVASVYQRAYVLKGDTARAEQALLRVRDSESAKPSAYLEALLRAGKMGAAKDYLLERLQDPERRTEALLDVQNFRNPPLTAEQRPVAMRKQQLLAMPEVRKVILEFGRIENFEYPEP